MLNRHALIAYLEEREAWTFGYAHGVRIHDCARFFAGGIAAVSGRDPLAAFGGSWTTERGAARVLARAGGMAAAVDSVLSRIDVSRAQRGDGGMTADGALVLVEGEAVVGLDPVRGFVRLPRAALHIAWAAG